MEPAQVEGIDLTSRLYSKICRSNECSLRNKKISMNYSKTDAELRPSITLGLVLHIYFTSTSREFTTRPPVCYSPVLIATRKLRNCLSQIASTCLPHSRVVEKSLIFGLFHLKHCLTSGADGVQHLRVCERETTDKHLPMQTGYIWHALEVTHRSCVLLAVFLYSDFSRDGTTQRPT